MDLTASLIDQLEWHWEHQLRPRLGGLTDEEYLWEPVPGWSLRPTGEAEGPWHERPMVDLVLHVHREVIHHGAEIALLRDLYLRHADL